MDFCLERKINFLPIEGGGSKGKDCSVSSWVISCSKKAGGLFINCI